MAASIWWLRRSPNWGGDSAAFIFMPWARVVYMSRVGQLDGYFPEYYASSVEVHALFSDPFPGGPVVFFKRKDSKIVFRGLEGLRGYTIGVVRGYVNTKAFDAATYLRKEPVKDDFSNIRKLLKKRVDLIVIDEVVGRDLMERHFPDRVDRIEVVAPPLGERALHVCFSRKVPGYEMRARRFNAGLRQMKIDGTLEAIMERHGFLKDRGD